MAAPNTIVLQGCLTPYEEKIGSGAITPGHILKRNSGDTVSVHATQGGGWDGSVAIENALTGEDLVNTTGNTIDDAYADGALVRYKYCEPGEIIYFMLDAGETISVGDKLCSKGDGTVEEAASGDNVIAIAEEAVTTTGSTGRVKGRVISQYAAP